MSLLPIRDYRSVYPSDSETAHGQDYAEKQAADGGLPLHSLEQFLAEIQEQPAWRASADVCCDFYDGNQLTPERKALLEDLGLAPAVENLIKPTINIVLGTEAKMRSDWRVGADDGQWQDVAEVQSMKLHEAERECFADRAISDAYASQIKGGLGWVEVSRETDPFRYPYRVRSVRRNEIWWDWRAQHPDLSDARWLLRKRWADQEQLVLYFPAHEQLIRNAVLGWPAFDPITMSGMDSNAEMLMGARDTELRTTLEEIEWRDVSRRRCMLFELWYRTWARAHVMTLPDGRVVEFDRQNRDHLQAVAYKLVTPRAAVVQRLRLSWWIGPHRVADVPATSRNFPYVPFWGFREDRTGAPYGMIRDMIWPQEEVNARRSKMMWLLTAKRVIADNDAVDTAVNTHAQIAEEVSRADAYVVLNANRRHEAGFRVDSDFQLNAQQFQVMTSAQESINRVAGVFQPMLGQTSNASSGLAISSLVEQGITTLGEVNDNARYARRVVGERLTDLINEDLIAAGEKAYQVGEGQSARQVVLNTVDEEGVPVNHVRMARTKVALEDIPTTATYRAQVFAMLSEIAKSLPPQAQAIVAPWLIENTELPSRKEIALVIRKVLGVPAINLPDHLQKQADEQEGAEQQRMKALNEQAIVLDLMERAARVLKLRAEVEATAASAQNTDGRNKAASMALRLQQMEQEIEALMSDYDAKSADLDAFEREAAIREQEDLHALRRDSSGPQRSSARNPKLPRDRRSKPRKDQAKEAQS